MEMTYNEEEGDIMKKLILSFLSVLLVLSLQFIDLTATPRKITGHLKKDHWQTLKTTRHGYEILSIKRHSLVKLITKFKKHYYNEKITLYDRHFKPIRIGDTNPPVYNLKKGTYYLKTTLYSSVTILYGVKYHLRVNTLPYRQIKTLKNGHAYKTYLSDHKISAYFLSLKGPSTIRFRYRKNLLDPRYTAMRHALYDQPNCLFQGRYLIIFNSNNRRHGLLHLKAQIKRCRLSFKRRIHGNTIAHANTIHVNRRYYDVAPFGGKLFYKVKMPHKGILKLRLHHYQGSYAFYRKGITNITAKYYGLKRVRVHRGTYFLTLENYSSSYPFSLQLKYTK